MHLLTLPTEAAKQCCITGFQSFKTTVLIIQDKIGLVILLPQKPPTLQVPLSCNLVFFQSNIFLNDHFAHV